MTTFWSRTSFALCLPLAHTKDIAEDVPKMLENIIHVHIMSTGPHALVVYAGMTELIIAFTFFRV